MWQTWSEKKNGKKANNIRNEEGDISSDAVGIEITGYYEQLHSNMLKILKKRTHLYKNITFQTDARGYRKPKYLLSVKAWVGKLSCMSLILPVVSFIQSAS